MSTGISITEDQRDTLAEIFNIGVGHAAQVLSDMTEKTIDLRVPSIHIHSIEEFEKRLKSGSGSSATVEMDFTGSVSGTSILLISRPCAIRMSKLLLGESIDDESPEIEWSETVTEIGNIVVNSVIGELANCLGDNFDYSLPIYSYRADGDLLSSRKHEEKSKFIISADARFEISDCAIDAEILVVFALSSSEELMRQVDSLYQETLADHG